MDTLLDISLHVHYGFVYLEPRLGEPVEDLIAARGGQSNGICGAAYRGILSMMTGLHTGEVPFTVTLSEQAPAVGDLWEDVVEVSFEAVEPAYVLSAFDTSVDVTLPGAGWYRARFCAVGMDAAREQDTRLSGDTVTDRYLLELWPAAAAPEVVVREGSDLARYWRSVAAETDPPPPPPSEAELAAAREREAQEETERRAEAQRLVELHLWGGTEPSARLRAVGPRAAQLARADRELAEQIAALEPRRQRLLAAATARGACERAGKSNLDWDAALAALDAGRTLPPPFDDSREAWTELYRRDGSGHVTMILNMRSHADAELPRQTIDPAAAALAAVLAAADDDAATAAFGAVDQAAAALTDPGVLYAELRRFLATG